MKMILTAVNAKYIHSNLAVYTLQASAEKAGVFPEIREFTINQSKDSMLRSLFLAHADVVCVSCYIWNISIVEDLITEYHKISPETKIWLGGPEVSYHAEEMLEQYPFLDGIMITRIRRTARRGKRLKRSTALHTVMQKEPSKATRGVRSWICPRWIFRMRI